MYTLQHKFKPGDVLQGIVGPNHIYLVDAIVLDPDPWYKVIMLDGTEYPIGDRMFLFSVPDVDENWTLYQEKPVPDPYPWEDILQYIVNQIDKLNSSKKKFDKGRLVAYNDMIQLLSDMEETYFAAKDKELKQNANS